MYDNDVKLVASCLQKDEQAWAELLSTFRHNCRIIARKYNSNTLFDDIFSEFIIKLLGRPGEAKGALERYDGSSSLKTYLSVVFTRVLLSHHRKRKTRGFVLCVDNLEDLSNQNSISCEQNADNNMQEEITGALAQLSSVERNIVNLYYYQELKLKQIADVFQCSESKISRQLKKILNNLKIILQEK